MSRGLDSDSSSDDGSQQPVKKAKVRQLTDAEYEIFISEVQSRTCLWNDEHNDFKNTSVTKKLWNEIGAAVNISGAEAKKKWKNLKDKYRKILQKPTPKSGSAAVPAKQKWRFFELMRFTRDVLVPTATIGNLRATTPPWVNDDVQEASGNDHIESQDNFDDNAHEATEASATVITELPQQRTSKKVADKRFVRPHRAKSALMSKEALEQKIVQLEERKIDAIMNMRNTSNKENDNDDDFHFLMSLLPYMKKLEPLEKLHARTQIQSVVMDVYRIHEENSRVSTNYVYSRPESNQSTSSSCIGRASTMSARNATPQSSQDADDVYTILNM